MREDGLPEGTPPAPAKEPASVTLGKVECEFCGCMLGPSGEYMQLSGRAKELRALEDTLSTVRDELSASQSDLAEALRERDEARAALAAKENPPDDVNARGQKLNITW
jgi:hypothetical protein